jgi:hypothetical protein
VDTVACVILQDALSFPQIHARNRRPWTASGSKDSTIRAAAQRRTSRVKTMKEEEKKKHLLLGLSRTAATTIRAVSSVIHGR